MNGHHEGGKLHAILSHKMVDYNTAAQIASALRRCGGRGVDVSFSGEKVHFGHDYRKWIKDKLEQAEWYILAYTEPAKNWDWCLYEAGYFEAAKERGDKTRRVICIHTGDVVPKPLDSFDSISVDDEPSLSAFCDGFLDRVNPSLPDKDKSAESKALAGRIIEAFRNKIENRYYGRHITLSIPNPASLSSIDLPDDTCVRGDPEIMSKLFEVGGESVIWSRVRNSLAVRDRRWVVQLVHAIKDINSNRTPQPITGTIEIPTEYTNLLPVLHRVDELENHSYECEILLADGITSNWAALREPRIRALITSLRMTVRFRYDVIDEFASDLRFRVKELGPRRFRESFRNLIFDIITESEAHGLTDSDILIECFERNEEHTEIAEIFREWEEEIFPQLFLAIGMSPDQSVWTKFDDRSFENNEIQEMDRIFDRLRSLNTRYLILALQRFRDLIASGDA